MRKSWMGMVAALLAGTGGMAWADDLNPQPLPPGATQMRKAGGENGIIAPSDSHSAGEKAGIIVVAHPQNKGTSKLRKAGGTQLTLHSKNGKGTTKNQIGGAGGTGKASLTNSTISGPGAKTNSSDIFTEKTGGKSAISGTGSLSKNGGKAGFDVFTKPGGNAGLSGNNTSPGATH